MKPGGGKAKGASFEREFCKRLSKWWGVKDAFWRSPGSGARGTVSNVNHAFGDISSPDAAGTALLQKISIECKKGYGSSWSPFDLLDGGPVVFRDFVKQAERDTEKAGRRYFWLVFQRPRKQICLCASYEFFMDHYPIIMEKISQTRVKTDAYDLVVVLLDDFFRLCSPEELR